jgi:hypothetical protein
MFVLNRCSQAGRTRAVCATDVCRDIDGAPRRVSFLEGASPLRPGLGSACHAVRLRSYRMCLVLGGDAKLREASAAGLPGERGDGLGDGSRAGPGEQDRVMVRAWHVGDRGLRDQGGDAVAELVRDNRRAGAGQAAGSAQ